MRSSQSLGAWCFGTLGWETLIWLVGAGALPAVSRGEVTFLKVADTSTVIPAGKWVGQRFADFTSGGIVSPVINQGHILFLGRISSATDNGAYTWSGGAIGLLADPTVTIPGRAPARFGELRYPSTFGGEYAFSSYDGIYRTVGGVLTKVLDPSSGFYGSSGPALDGPNTWFFGDNPNDGIFRSTNGALTTIAAAGDPTPSAPGYNFNSLNSEVGAGGDGVFFWGYSQTGATKTILVGMYLYSNGTLTRVADTHMAAPGGGQFTWFLNFDIPYDGKTAAFFGRDTVHGGGVYMASNGMLQSLIFNGETAPGGGTFNIPGYFSTDTSVDSGDVALSASLSGGQSAIFIDWAGAGLQRVIGSGDTLLGKKVLDVQISNEALSGNQLTFYADFAGGGSGIYVANVPEPAAAGMLLVLACAMTRRRRLAGRPCT